MIGLERRTPLPRISSFEDYGNLEKQQRFEKRIVLSFNQDLSSVEHFVIKPGKECKQFYRFRSYFANHKRQFTVVEFQEFFQRKISLYERPENPLNH